MGKRDDVCSFCHAWRALTATDNGRNVLILYHYRPDRRANYDDPLHSTPRLWDQHRALIFDLNVEAFFFLFYSCKWLILMIKIGFEIMPRFYSIQYVVQLARSSHPSNKGIYMYCTRYLKISSSSQSQYNLYYIIQRSLELPSWYQECSLTSRAFTFDKMISLRLDWLVRPRRWRVKVLRIASSLSMYTALTT